MLICNMSACRYPDAADFSFVQPCTSGGLRRRRKRTGRARRPRRRRRPQSPGRSQSGTGAQDRSGIPGPRALDRRPGRRGKPGIDQGRTRIRPAIRPGSQPMRLTGSRRRSAAQSGIPQQRFGCRPTSFAWWPRCGGTSDCSAASGAACRRPTRSRRSCGSAAAKNSCSPTGSMLAEPDSNAPWDVRPGLPFLTWRASPCSDRRDTGSPRTPARCAAAD